MVLGRKPSSCTDIISRGETVIKQPNFLIIGAAKSGTSALHRYLKQHPQVFMPYRKEAHYFSYMGETPNTQGPRDFVNSAITDWDAYLALFADVSDEIAIGEASPTYLDIPQSAERIAATLPNVKLIAILRQPSERAFSAYLHLRRDNREHLSFEEALAAEPERIAANWEPLWHLMRGGFYYQMLLPYFETFPREQIKVILHDDFLSNAAKTLRDLFAFLGVSTAFEPDMSAIPNRSGLPRNRSLQQFYQSFFDGQHPIKRLAQTLIPEEVRWRVITRLRNRNLTRVKLDEATRGRLNELYREDIGQLQQLLDRDLSHWL